MVKSASISYQCKLPEKFASALTSALVCEGQGTAVYSVYAAGTLCAE